MQLDAEFYKLPLLFDAEKLAEEISQFTESDWLPHPQNYSGNSALLLISKDGVADEHVGFVGAMQPTRHLLRCPYLQQVLASFNSVLGNTRLMRIDGGGEAHPHIDANYYWLQRVRIHIPIVTFPEVEFICGNAVANMAPGETWLFNTWKQHNVLNPKEHQRIHLVIDTVGSPEFWHLVNQSACLTIDPAKRTQPTVSPRYIPYNPQAQPTLIPEVVNFPVVMSPWEQQQVMECLFASGDSDDDPEDLDLDETAQTAIQAIKAALTRFQQQWRYLWAQYGTAANGWSAYEQALTDLKQTLDAYAAQKLPLPNGHDMVKGIRKVLVQPALNPELATDPPVVYAAGRSKTSTRPNSPQPNQAVTTSAQSRFDHPVFIVAAPRSGSSLLFETLAQSPDFWTVGGEAHGLFEGIAALQPQQRNWESNRLQAQDATPEIAAQLQERFLQRLRDYQGTALFEHPNDQHSNDQNSQSLRLLEKTPKNALRIPFLNAIFPDARFIYLYRNPRDNISSIMEAWRSGRFRTYPNLPGWSKPIADETTIQPESQVAESLDPPENTTTTLENLPWSLLLIPGWEALRDQALETIAMTQWMATHQTILADLQQIERDRWCTVTYRDLLADPQSQLKRLCQFAGVRWEQTLDKDLPLSRYTLTPPDPNKWQKNAAELQQVLPWVQPLEQELETLMTQPQPQPQSPSSLPPKTAPTVTTPAPKSEQAAEPTKVKPIRSLQTGEFTTVLAENGISLGVSTYQAGKLLILQADEKSTHIHAHDFSKPMGLAIAQGKLALGTANQVLELRNIPAMAPGIAVPKGQQHDACYVPRKMHVTGDIDIHELAWASGENQDELWFVNTRFSCLCTLDDNYSFVPRWRPPFVSAYEMSDRCHLNGLAIRDGQPRYVTALGATDTPAGWRTHKANGGLLMDITTNDILAKGLSMPHSPRWYRDQLWVLESGKGALAKVDVETGDVTLVAELPGFTRGIDFYGDFAFIGLSQVRESAVFSGIPLTQTLSKRVCGVWMVNIVTGEIVGFLRFQNDIQEIFAISVFENQRFPAILDNQDTLIKHSYVLPDKALAEAVEIDHSRELAQPYVQKGIQHCQDGELDDAVAAFQKALAIQPDHVPAQFNLGVTLADLGRFQEAIPHLEQVVHAEASHAEAHNSLGYVYGNQQQFERAIAHYRQALKIQPNFAQARQNLESLEAHVTRA